MDSLDPLKSRLTLSWDTLPCRLHNGHITSYIIQYTNTGVNDSEVRSISTLDNHLECMQEPVGPYRCYLNSTLLIEDQVYTFQVAAKNRYGVGQFSNTVNATLYSKGMQISFRLN